LLAYDREIPLWGDSAIRKAVSPLPDRRQLYLFEYLHDLRMPNRQFLNKTRPPLSQRNSVARHLRYSGMRLLLL
jgi:hypothetical protein